MKWIIPMPEAHTALLRRMSSERGVYTQRMRSERRDRVIYGEVIDWITDWLKETNNALIKEVLSADSNGDSKSFSDLEFNIVYVTPEHMSNDYFGFLIDTYESTLLHAYVTHPIFKEFGIRSRIKNRTMKRRDADSSKKEEPHIEIELKKFIL